MDTCICMFGRCLKSCLSFCQLDVHARAFHGFVFCEFDE